MIKRWHHLIQGYTQNLHAPTGIEQLWLALQDVAGASNVALELWQWDDQWADIAGFIKRCSTPDVEIFIYAYSWGAGHGFTTLAKELQKLKINVKHAVLCDPVWRRPGIPTFLGGIGSALSLTPWNKINIPDNVARVSWCRQHNNTPAGHDLVADNGKKTIIDPAQVLTDVVHQTIDESPWFQSKAIEVATVG